MRTNLQKTQRAVKQNRTLLFLLVPGLLYYIVFHYIPMYGISLAFLDYRPTYGVGVFRSYLQSDWLGLENFRAFLGNPRFPLLLRNTVLLSLYSLLWGFPFPIIFALCLNEITGTFYKRAAQTISYLPHFISTVSLVSMMVVLLSPTSGYINLLIQRLGGRAIYFFGDPRWFRSLYIGSGIWQNLGWGAIIYLAAMSRIDQELYESASIDGAGRLGKIWHVTLPGIKSTIVILLILRIGQFINVGAEKVILMYNPLTYGVADVIQTYVYRRGILYQDYSYATAVGLFNSLVNLVLLFVANAIARKYTEESLW